MSGRVWPIRFLRILWRRHRLLSVVAAVQLLGYALVVSALVAALCGADYGWGVVLLLGAGLVGIAFLLGWVEQGCQV